MLPEAQRRPQCWVLKALFSWAHTGFRKYKDSEAFVCLRRKQSQNLVEFKDRLLELTVLTGCLITSFSLHTKSMGRKTKHIFILFLSVLCSTHSQRVR